jgi:hypothetical protein
VRRSLITLKALTYASTGGIVAAATTYGYQPNWGLPSAADRAEIIRIMTAEAPQGGTAPPSPSAAS